MIRAIIQPTDTTKNTKTRDAGWDLRGLGKGKLFRHLECKNSPKGYLLIMIFLLMREDERITSNQCQFRAFKFKQIVTKWYQHFFYCSFLSLSIRRQFLDSRPVTSPDFLSFQKERVRVRDRITDRESWAAWTKKATFNRSSSHTWTAWK